MEKGMDKRLVLYMHAGSGNHGCEAIVNSLCHMIEPKPLLVTYRGKEDESYSLKELCDILPERRFEDHRLMHVGYYLYRKLSGDRESFLRYRYGEVFRGEKPPLAVSIGGDNYCYDNMLADLALSHEAFRKAGTKTVLLGCSIEPELLKRPELLEDLENYDLIIARETITYEALCQALDPKKTRILCYPDPAFTLKGKKPVLPEGFAAGNTIVINVSPMVVESEKKGGITMACYEELIRYLIQHTDMQIALIPHVIWEQNDDRRPLHELFLKFQNTGRVLEIPDGSCEELKGYIGSCRFFVGARTHATIAAYSSLVPTLVIGYSVKARGIARDLFGTEEGYVLPVQKLQDPGELVRAFSGIYEREAEIKGNLQEIMPSYVERALLTGREIDRLWEECKKPQEI